MHVNDAMLMCGVATVATQAEHHPVVSCSLHAAAMRMDSHFVFLTIPKKTFFVIFIFFFIDTKKIPRM
jgi:hypothetical protein